MKKNQYSSPFVIGTYIYVFKIIDISKSSASAPDFSIFEKKIRETMIKDVILKKEKFKDTFESAYVKINPPSSQTSKK